MNTARVVPITVWIHAGDVQHALGCCRALAYWHLRRAAQRGPDERGLLRVAPATWEAYARRVFGAAKADGEAKRDGGGEPPPPSAKRPSKRRGLRLVASNGAPTDLTIRPTTPRTEKR